MDNLLFTLWKRPIARRQDPWLDPPASGLGRLLAAVAVIGIGACILDHAAREADTLVIASYGSLQEGEFK
ncbi:MAG: hypothetical protein JF620_02420 [Mesorhizobium sp.]|nr:hypothetical protein [Mesorhizobium sp.]